MTFRNLMSVYSFLKHCILSCLIFGLSYISCASGDSELKSNDTFSVKMTNKGAFAARLKIIYYEPENGEQMIKTHGIPVGQTIELRVPNAMQFSSVAVQFWHWGWSDADIHLLYDPIDVCFEAGGSIFYGWSDLVNCY